MSLPLAYISRVNKNNIPAICAYSINFSFGLRREMISYNVNIICPPSKAGIGRKFINASATDRNAVISQKLSQFQLSGNRLPMAPKPPMLLAPSAVATYLNDFTYDDSRSVPISQPLGIEPNRP